MKSYDSYKDTGNEFLDEIPNDWDIKKIKFLSSKVGDGLHGTPEYTENTEFYFINGNNLGDGLIQITPQTKSISEEQYYSNDKKLTLQTLLLSINGTIGNVAFYRGETVMLGKSAAYIKFYDNINIQYIRWYLESSVFKNYYELELSGTTIQNLSLESIKNTPLTFPEKEEQTFIASFLDQKTSQIDKLIKQKEKLLKLLAEKRTAIITQAVTKGLDPTVEMKDSGIDWLGKIPRHWSSVSLKWISKRFSGGTPDKSKAEYWLDGDIPWFNSGIVNDFYISQPSNFITEEGFLNSSAKYFPPNSLLMALAGQGKTKGMVGLSKIKATCNQSLAVVIINENEPRYYLWWLHSKYLQIRGLSSQDGRDGLNLEMLGSIPCPLPPVEEQVQIALWIESKIQNILNSEKTINQSIDTLKEYREALITSAVTGQIDVRKEVSNG